MTGIYRRRWFFSWFGLLMLLTFIVSTGSGLAEMEPTSPPGKPAAARQDKRTRLYPPLAGKEGMRATMQEYWAAIRDIVAALGKQDFEQAANVAHEELGFPKHHLASQREAGATFPPKYHKLALELHQAAEDLAKAIPSKDIKTILPQFEKTIGACAACHRVYKF
jgi:hypothetical protein